MFLNDNMRRVNMVTKISMYLEDLISTVSIVTSKAIPRINVTNSMATLGGKEVHLMPMVLLLVEFTTEAGVYDSSVNPNTISLTSPSTIPPAGTQGL